MKKTLIIFIAAAMLSLSCACTKNDEPSDDKSAAAASASVQESSENTASGTVESSVQQSSTEESSALSQASEKEASVVESSSAQNSSDEISHQESREEKSRQESTEQESAQSMSGEVSQQSSETAQSPAPVQQSSAVNENVQVTGITISAQKTEMYVGGTFALNIRVLPENASDKSIHIEWSDNNVISVSSDGIITAKAPGSAQITVSSSNGRKAVCDVTVREKPQAQPSQESEKQQTSQTSQSSTQQQKPAEQSSQSSESGNVQQDEAVGYVGADWFNDAVFVGDSVTLKLSYYAENGSLGNAAFLCAGSLGWNNALWELNRSGNVHPVMCGTKYTVDEGVKASGKNKVFIMLGMNDIGLYGVDGAADAMITLTDRIKQKSPDVQIYIESVTPMLRNMQRTYLNNKTIPQFNSRLREICSSRGYHYLDVASVMKDSNGDLEYENCSDPTAMGIHFTDTGCRKWVDYLKRHVSQ